MSNRKGKEKVTKQQVQQMVKSAINSGLVRKYILTATGTVVTPASIDNTGTMYSLDSVAQGTGDQARTGNNSHVKEIWYHGQVVNGDTTNTFRFVLFRWNDNTTATASDLFTSSNYSTSYYNVINIKSGKLQILADRVISAPYVKMHEIIRLKQNHPIQWGGSSASPAINGALYLFIVSDSTAASHPNVAGNAMVFHEQ